jgi:hypothetical protein
LIDRDCVARNSVIRVSKDYRAALSTVKPYPGGRTPGTKSHLAEAKSNIRFVWTLKDRASRFSDGGWPVLYTAQRYRTACAEVGYHLQEVYLPAKLPGVDITVPHIVYQLKVRGRRRDLSFDEVHFGTLCGSGPDEMAACQNIARQAISEGVDYILAPSARAIGKRCYPILRKNVAKRPFAVAPLKIVVWDDVDTVLVRGPRRPMIVRIDRIY